MLVNYKIHNRRDTPYRAPKAFRIYASNDDNCWTNINNVNWVLIDERTNVTYTNYIAEYTINNSMMYRYYAMIVYSTFGNDGQSHMVQFAEWELYGVPGYFYITLGPSGNLGNLYLGDFRIINKYISSYQTDLLYDTLEQNIGTYNLSLIHI